MGGIVGYIGGRNAVDVDRPRNLANSVTVE
jgi:glucosamine 6-phosphate synthetase-like amidotransferase/phosphosugar isomerase protein